MISLLWFTGIGWHTEVRDIGWFWMLFVVAIVALIYFIVQLVRDLRR